MQSEPNTPPEITLLVPSRGRPTRFMNMLKTAKATASLPFKVFLYVDDDDKERDNYPQSDDVITRFDGPCMRTAKTLLFFLEKVQTRYFMLASDDIEFETGGWDCKLMQAMPPDDLAIIAGYTTFKNSDGHFLCSMKWHRSIGLFPPDVFTHFGPDGWSIDVAKRAGRFIQLQNVAIRHNHFKNGKAENDDTYQRARKDGDATHAMRYIIANEKVRDGLAEKIKQLAEQYARFMDTQSPYGA